MKQRKEKRSLPPQKSSVYGAIKAENAFRIIAILKNRKRKLFGAIK